MVRDEVDCEGWERGWYKGVGWGEGGWVGELLKVSSLFPQTSQSCRPLGRMLFL